MQALYDLAAEIGETLKARGEKIAVNESSSGGLISTALLSVPSAVVHIERNLLLNPRHPDAHEVSIDEILPFPWDERLFP